MRKNSIKNTRIDVEVPRELSEIIHGGIRDPGIRPVTNVVSVEAMPNLKCYKAYISILENEDAAKVIIEGLKSAEGCVRRELVRRINLRNTPELRFIPDQSTEYGVNISKLVDKVTKNLHQGGGQDKEGGEEEI